MKKSILILLILLGLASCKPRRDPQPCIQTFTDGEGLPVQPLCQ